MSRGIVEIRAAEGGEDAKLLVEEQRAIYLAMCARVAIQVSELDRRHGVCVLRVGDVSYFRDEAGGHRWQRIPPTEKGGRVHTSTVTVAVLVEPTASELEIRESDLEWRATRGSGAGGQARNKTSNAIQLRHLPSGTLVRCETERSQKQNRDSALALLRARLHAASKVESADAINGIRRAQVGSGMRGDKRRTIRVRDDSVVDHVTGRRWRFSAYRRGELA